ncbi:hypothetical protein [Novosphingobium olei]|uniref:Uncharacterized protein n=1 Tax=Novosphingobium olei TaxID=2728851 RepID=A0A7Y0GAA7_9SPHN|nr:hypothetical protein [Novosphingobium olei]NML94865.1 hypothetical protein [Novosphingobium olei]BEV00351.1 hypothetical protein NSDW_14450 [Novosphingobium olei]
MNTTIRGESSNASADFWKDHATVLRRDAADGVFHNFATLHSGTFAAMVRLVSRMPEAERNSLVIEKAGDRQYGPGEIMAMSRRNDFPG